MANSAVRRRRSAFAAGLATLAMALGVAVAPAQAVDKISYIALGDSYAAGQGAGPYLDDCFRSENAYSELADEAKAVKLVTNAACSGKTTQDVVNTQLGRLNPSTELVTITAGGNNLGFGDIVTFCGAVAMGDTTAGPACDIVSANATAKITSGQLAAEVTVMIQSVKAAAPNAKIVVTGYPYLVDPLSSPATDPMSVFIYKATQLANGLDGSIENAAVATGVQYVDVRSVFLGHGAFSANDPWINFGSPNSADNFHPNAEGYQAYFETLSLAGAYSAS